MQDSNNSNELLNWIEESISNKILKYYEYEHFSNVQEIDTGNFGKVYRATWNKTNKTLALKSFNDAAVKEIVREIELHRRVDFHENIISFHGVTSKKENQNEQLKKYWLVMEYADGGALRTYLKNNFEKLTWDDKYNLAFQLANAVACLHDEGIVHCNLHSGNILIHQGSIRLSDFGFSKSIEQTTKQHSKVFGVIPYIDPKVLAGGKRGDSTAQQYTLNVKSDVYSVGVLLWEISSGRPPFYVEGEQYEIIALAIEILQGLREDIVPGTPEDYVNIYTECWDNEPDKRPTINEVVNKLSSIINNSN